MDCVNGYMTEYRLFLGEVEAGQEEMTSIWVNDTDLESGNIETIGELSFCLEVTDASDYNPLDSTPPITLRADKNNVRSVESGGTTVLEEAGITLTYTGSEGELCEDGAFRFRVENHSERNIWLYTMETYVNGESADLFLFDELAPDAWGKCEMWLTPASRGFGTSPPWSWCWASWIMTPMSFCWKASGSAFPLQNSVFFPRLHQQPGEHSLPKNPRKKQRAIERTAEI